MVIAPRLAPAAAEPLSREEIRQIVREEVARAHDERPQAAVAPAPSEGSIELAQHAITLVDTAAARRRWTEEDRQALRAEMGSLTQQQRIDVMRRFATAVNEGGMKIETRGSPF